MYISIVACVLFFARFIRGDLPMDGEVLVLDDDNFAEALSTHSLMLIEFYAPWCGHCKSLAPEWAKAAVTLKDSPVRLAKVDATVATVTAKTYGIGGFPTIKYFKGGHASEYNGGRTEPDIVAWVNKKSGPAAVTISTLAELQKFQDAHDAVAVGAFQKMDSTVASRFLSHCAGTPNETPFAITASKEVLSHLKVELDTVVVLKKFDEKRDDYTLEESFNSLSLDEFLNTVTTPRVVEFSQTTSKKVFDSPIKKHSLLFYKLKDDNKDLFDFYGKLAKDYLGKMLFLTVSDAEDNKQVANYFALTEDQLPKVIVADLASGIKKYPLDTKLNSHNLNAHITGVLAGAVKPTLKSEDAVPEDLMEPVKVIKGKSFEDIVLNNKKDVMVEIYAPWCGHCKKLAPIYDEVAAHFADQPHIVLAKMDGTANEIDVPGFETTGFPSLFFVPGNTKIPVRYEGGREKEDLIAYIEANAAKVHSVEEEL